MGRGGWTACTILLARRLSSRHPPAGMVALIVAEPAALGLGEGDGDGDPDGDAETEGVDLAEVDPELPAEAVTLGAGEVAVATGGGGRGREGGGGPAGALLGPGAGGWPPARATRARAPWPAAT